MRILVVFMLVSTVALGGDGTAGDDDRHFAAHFGLSYALTGAVYGLANKGFHFEQNDALVFAATTVMAVGAVRQAFATPEGGAPNTDGIWQNALGVAAFSLSAKMFSWEF